MPRLGGLVVVEEGEEEEEEGRSTFGAGLVNARWLVVRIDLI